MSSVTRLVFFILLLSALGTDHFLFAQGTDLGTIRGTVKDASGAVIANAKVTITDLDTNTSRRTNANGAGDFEVFGLKSGRYKVSVTASGMSTQEINDVVLNGSATVGVNITLRVAGGAEKIEVSAQAVTINTENPTISDTIGHQAVIDLPRDTRDIYSFLYLNPNITQADASGDLNFKFIGGQSYGGSFSVDGQRSNGGIFGQPTQSEPSLEAVDELNVLSNSFSAEYAGAANIRITTKRGQNQFHGSLFYNNANSALGALSLQDHAGIADFQPNAFASKYPTPYFNINDLGGSIGGPVKGLKKTWFFAAYERDYNVSPVNIATSRLAHPSLWTGDFSLMDDVDKPDVPSGGVLTPQEIATDTVGGAGLQFIQIPSRLLNPSVQSLITKYFPHIGVAAPIDSTTGRIPSYQTQIPGRDTLDTGSLRLDHDFSDKDHVYASYNTSAETSATSAVVSPYLGLGLTQNNRQNQTVQLSYTRIFNPTLVNEMRGGFNKENLLRHSNTTLEGFLSSIGFDAAGIAAYGSVVGQFALSTFGHPAINFSNTFATFTNGGRNTYRPEDQNLITFGDTLTWVRGKHNLRMGADFVRNQAVDGFALNRGNPRGSMTYSQPTTCAATDADPNASCFDTNPDPFTDLLMGLPPTSASYVLQARPPMNVYNWEEGYYAQDDWKISSKLTLNLGLRYDLITPFIEKDDLLINFDPAGANPTGNAGVFIIPSSKTLPYLDTRIANYGYITASQSGLGRGLVRMDRNNIAPRLGFAYKIGGKSVLRAGWGVFYPTSAAQGIRDAIGTNPFNQGVTSRKTLEGWPSPSQDGISPITGGTLKGFGNSVTANAIPIGIQSPRIQQYNVTFEREIVRDGTLRVSYLGTHMDGLIAGKDLDELAPNTTPFGTTQGDGATPCDPTQGSCAYSPQDLARLPFPIVGEFLLTYGNFGHGNSNAFQTEFTRRYKSGLMLDMSYTYLDQKSSALDTANSSLGGIGYNPFNPNADYGTDGYVSKHRFIAYGLYDLPIGRNHRIGSSFSRLADTLLGGWQTTFNMFAKSGQGFTPFWICDDCDPVEPGNIAVSSIDAVGDFNTEPSFRPLVVSNNINTGKHGSNAYIWNADAFGLPSIGADLLSNPAVAKRNSLTGPGAWGVNLGIHKAFPIGERVVATLGADFDNIFNHPLLAPDANFGGGGGSFAEVGEFNMNVIQPGLPNAGQLGAPTVVFLNSQANGGTFGQLTQSFQQEGVLSQRTIRLRLRVTF
jgi:hypothetical protein